MNTKGFTLVELLAVVIILALLALLTSTSVTKLLKDSKDELSNTQIELIKSAAKTWGSNNINILPSSGECSYLTLGDLKEFGFIDSRVIDANTNQEISDNLKIKIITTTNSYGNDITTYEVNASDVSNCGHNLYKKYENGEIVYFNVSTGKKCNSSEYNEENSLTGYNGINPSENKTSCLKFYAFNDSVESNKVNLLLDHNTTAEYAFYESNSSSSGNAIPFLATKKVQEDTSNWKGIITSRLINFEDIAKITKYESTDYIEYFFDSNLTSPASTCTTGNTTGCKYGWLYDRTNITCKTYGCLNNGDNVSNVYWTYTNNNSGAYLISYEGKIRLINDKSLKYGIRPVIEVSKGNL